MLKNLNRLRGLAFLLLFGGALLTSVSGQVEKRIAETRKLYEQTNEKIADCEKNGEYSTTFLTELVINKNNGSYPAVGIFRSVAKFYYTYGDREKNPYPDRLLKITVTTNRSNQTDYSEYLFDPAGRLIFFLAKNNDRPEHRLYLASEKPFRSQKGDKTVNLKNREEIESFKTILQAAKKLRQIFINSLD